VQRQALREGLEATVRGGYAARAEDTNSAHLNWPVTKHTGITLEHTKTMTPN
jgi:hypothetical protein